MTVESKGDQRHGAHPSDKGQRREKEAAGQRQKEKVKKKTKTRNKKKKRGERSEGDASPERQ